GLGAIQQSRRIGHVVQRGRQRARAGELRSTQQCDVIIGKRAVKSLLEIAARLAKALGPPGGKTPAQAPLPIAPCVILEDVVQGLAALCMLHQGGKIFVVIGPLLSKPMACQPYHLDQSCHCRSSATVSKDLNLASMSLGSTSPCSAL